MSFHWLVYYKMTIEGKNEFITSAYISNIVQMNNRCLHQRSKLDLQLFLVDTWSVCSDFTHQQGPLMLEPTIVNSTVILDIPHLPNNCQITAAVRSQNMSNSSGTITLG